VFLQEQIKDNTITRLSLSLHGAHCQATTGAEVPVARSLSPLPQYRSEAPWQWARKQAGGVRLFRAPAVNEVDAGCDRGGGGGGAAVGEKPRKIVPNNAAITHLSLSLSLSLWRALPLLGV